MIAKTEKQIRDVIDKTWESMDDGSAWPGQNYEEGVRNALSWVLGEDEDPMVDE
jgi:hypothetical protein